MCKRVLAYGSYALKSNHCLIVSLFSKLWTFEQEQDVQDCLSSTLNSAHSVRGLQLTLSM